MTARGDGARRVLELAIRASRRSIRRDGSTLHAEAEVLSRALWRRYWLMLGNQPHDQDEPELLEDEP